jgi:DJ-1 family protein
MQKNILVPIAQGTEELEACAIIDILRRAGAKVTLAGETNIITCSRGLKIIPDKYFIDIEDDEVFDAIVLPGGLEGVERLCVNEYVANILRRHNNANALICAICAAPTILSDLKILKGDTLVTSHPSQRRVFKEANYREERIVVSGNIITSRGAGTAVEFALKIVELLYSEELCDKIKNDIVF